MFLISRQIVSLVRCSFAKPVVFPKDVLSVETTTQPLITIEMTFFLLCRNRIYKNQSNCSFQQIPRYFHTAVSTKNYMVVLGGRTSQKEYDDSVLVYRYKCNHWTDLSAGGIGPFGLDTSEFLLLWLRKCCLHPIHCLCRVVGDRTWNSSGNRPNSHVESQW